MARWEYAYAEKRDGKYWAVTSWRTEGPFDTWRKADRRAAKIFRKKLNIRYVVQNGNPR